MIIDCHTHSLRPDSLVNIYPHSQIQPGFIYSCGIHPWHIANINPPLLADLAEKITLPQVAAVGETGLDLARPLDLTLQTEIFLRHIALSEQAAKPLIIHCVKAWQQLMEIHSSTRPSQPWIIHGFRGKPQLADALLARGFFISLGYNFNSETALIIPSSHLLIETDDLPDVTIADVAARVAKTRGENPDALLHPSPIWNSQLL